MNSFIPRLSFLALLLLSACGYRTVTCEREGGPIAVNIPLIHLDEDGVLRGLLATNLGSTGDFLYNSCDCRYRLIVKLLGNHTEKIGYVWDQNPLTGTIQNRLYPSEGRRLIKATVSIKDTRKNCYLVKPFTISAHSDYDFVNPTSLMNIQFTDLFQQTQSVLQYSLGQLDSEEGANTSTYIPLYKSLTQKIIQELLVRTK